MSTFYGFMAIFSITVMVACQVAGHDAAAVQYAVLTMGWFLAAEIRRERKAP